MISLFKDLDDLHLFVRRRNAREFVRNDRYFEDWLKWIMKLMYSIWLFDCFSRNIYHITYKYASTSHIDIVNVRRKRYYRRQVMCLYVTISIDCHSWEGIDTDVIEIDEFKKRKQLKYDCRHKWSISMMKWDGAQLAFNWTLYLVVCPHSFVNRGTISIVEIEFKNTIQFINDMFYFINKSYRILTCVSTIFWF